MYEFVAGAICVLSFVAGLFFFQFYRKLGDRFFLLFSVAFHIFAIERIALVLNQINDESRSLVYLIRLIGFIIILIAIIDKNRKK